MRFPKLCVSVGSSILLMIPGTIYGASTSFTNHTHSCVYNCGGAPNLYRHADMNNDGREDLVFAYHPYMGDNGAFYVELSNGDGTYGGYTAYGIPQGTDGTTTISDLTVGDFNNDGKPDVAVFGSDNNLYLFLNNGAGALTLGGTFSLSTSAAGYAQATAGDFNHDNLTDLAFVQSGRLTIWFGNGKGGFTPGPSMGVNGTAPVLGDFDGDGKADLLLADTANQNVAYVLYGDGTGNFPQTATVTMPSGAANFSAADVNSDGLTDVVGVQIGTPVKNLSVFYGQASRTFATRKTITTARCPFGPATAADLDGNGVNDLIIPEADCSDGSTYGARYIDVITRNTNGTYNGDQTIYTSPAVTGSYAPYYEIASAPTVLRGDLNTKPDVFFSTCQDDHCFAYQETTLLNTTSGGFPSCSAPTGTKGVNVCSPTSAVASPVAFSVGASGSVIMRDVEVWVDGIKKAEQIDGFSNYTFLNKSVSLSAGSHNVAIYAAGWDLSTIKKLFTLTVK
jgi:hypothetical protein